MTRLLLLSHEAFGSRLAGPAIRFAGLAGALQRAGHDVTLCGSAVATGSPAGGVPPRVLPRGAALRALIRAHDLVITSGTTLTPAVRRAAGSRGIVHDLLIPVYYESLLNHPVAGDTAADAARRRHLAVHHRDKRRHLLRQLPLADHYLCGSERQRDMLLGWLAAAGAVAHERGNERLPVDRLVSIVPPGLPPEPPPAAGDRRLFPGCTESDTVLLWWGCAYDWYDLGTVLAALAHLAPRRPDIKLVLGAAQVPGQAAVTGQMARLAARPEFRHLFGRSVQLLNDWVPYAERGRYLAAADAGIYAHPATLESHFAVRTRFYDYLWAGLPVIVTAGDVCGDAVRDRQLGITVPPGDAPAWAQAMVRLADDRAFRAACRAHAAAARGAYAWEVAVQPLLRLCGDPPSGRHPQPAGAAAYAGHLLGRAAAAWRTGGGGTLLRKTARHLGKLRP